MDDGDPVGPELEREETLAQIEPYSLDGVALWRIGRERHEGDGVRNGQGGAGVPTGAIENHDDMVVGGQGLGELGQEQVHGDGGDGWQDEGEFGAGGGFDGGEDIGPVEPLVAHSRRPLALHPPAVTGPPLLADAGFIQEKQTDALAGLGLRGSGQGLGEPFF